MTQSSSIQLYPATPVTPINPANSGKPLVATATAIAKGLTSKAPAKPAKIPKAQTYLAPNIIVPERATEAAKLDYTPILLIAFVILFFVFGGKYVR